MALPGPLVQGENTQTPHRKVLCSEESNPGPSSLTTAPPCCMIIQDQGAGEEVGSILVPVDCLDSCSSKPRIRPNTHDNRVRGADLDPVASLSRQLSKTLIAPRQKKKKPLMPKTHSYVCGCVFLVFLFFKFSDC